VGTRVAKSMQSAANELVNKLENLSVRAVSLIFNLKFTVFFHYSFIIDKHVFIDFTQTFISKLQVTLKYKS
jgi:hypothetical protein